MFKNRSQKKKNFDTDIMSVKEVKKNNDFIATFTSESKIDKSFKLVTEFIDIPTKNSEIRIVTQRVFNAFDIMKAILKEEDCIELYMCVYRIAKKTTKELIMLYEDKKINNINIATSIAIPKITPEIYRELLNFEQRANFKMKLVQMHAKIILIKKKDKNYIVEGSGNLSQNQKIEQNTINNDIDIYNFHKNWIDSL